MNFWDRFVLFMYRGWIDTPNGRDAMVRLFDCAFARGRLQPRNLRRRSLLILLAVCPPGSALRAAAEHELAGRGPVPAERFRELLAGIRPGGFPELLGIGRGGTVLAQGMLAGVLLGDRDHEVVFHLARFLGRVYFDEPGSHCAAARLAVGAALQVYYACPPGTDDYLSVLYRHVLLNVFHGPAHRVPPGPAASIFTGWLADIDAHERWFLGRCAALGGGELDVWLLYLHLYAGLTPAQIADVLGEFDHDWTAGDVLARLEWVWGQVIG